MKKDAVYTLRMTSRVREALSVAAMKERRTVASLLDKIITDFLAREGLLRGPEFGTERRKFLRKKITLPAKTFLKIGFKDEVFPSVVLDISKGGVLLTYPKGAEISFPSTGELPQFEICLELPRQEEELCFDCEARHIRYTGDEIRVGASFSNPRSNYLERLDTYIM
jgi:hypothetical protein